MTQTAADWRSRTAGKLVSPGEAVATIRDGDTVWAGGWTSVPPQLCGALAARGPELHDVTIVSFLTPYKWDTPENLANFTVVTAYASPFDRAAVREGRNPRRRVPGRAPARADDVPIASRGTCPLPVGSLTATLKIDPPRNTRVSPLLGPRGSLGASGDAGS